MDVKLIRTNRRRNGHVGGFILEVKKHILMLLLLLVVLSGLLLGNFFVKGDTDTYETVKTVFEGYLSSVSGQTLMKNFILQLAVNCTVCVVNLIFGLCAVGFPVPVIILLIKGLSIGALSSFLYAEYALKGFGYCMLIFYPIQIIITLILMSSGKESFSMSVSLLKLLTGQRQKTVYETELKMYMVRFLIYIAVICIISFISAVLSVYVIKLFDF